MERLFAELKYLRYKSNQVFKEGSEYAGQVDLSRNAFAFLFVFAV